MTRRAVALAVVTVAAAVVAAGSLARRAGDRSPSPAAVAPARAAAPGPAVPPAAPAGAPRFEPGVVRAYEIDLDETVAIDGAARPLRIAVAGTWTLAVAAVGPDAIVVRAELDAGALAVEPADPASPEVAAARAALAAPHWLSVAPDGRIVALHFEPGQPELARTVVRVLAGAFQLVEPAAPARAWEAVEADATGAYLAAYERDGARLAKARVRYVRVAGAAGGRAGAITITGGTRATVDASGWPGALELDETVHVPAGGAAPEVTMRVRLSARLAGTTRGAPAAVALDGLDREAPGDGGGSRDADAALVGGDGWPEIWADLAALDGAGGFDAALAIARLEALLRTRPAVASEAGRALAGAPDGAARRALIAGLAGAGTDEAQRELARFAGDDGADAGARAHATAALGLVAAPTAEAIAALDALSRSSDRSLRTTALLALGAAAGKDPAHGVVDALLARYAAATDDAERAAVLRALGNAGDARALDAIHDGLSRAEPRVRAAAVEALRFVATPDADALIADRLARDPAAPVRRAAVFAARFRPLDALGATVAAALAGDPSALVRLDLVALVGDRRAELAAADDLLRRAASDPDEAVRRAARERLDG